MKITIESIPHASQRYPTCGDWEVMPDGTLAIRVSEEMGEDSCVLVALHELIEAKVAMRRGVTVKEVDDFDKEFEIRHRKGNTLDGERTDNDEPGDDPLCPVFREHQFATAIEGLVCAMMEVPWPEHAKRVEALP
jgi:hypothetical protein